MSTQTRLPDTFFTMPSCANDLFTKEEAQAILKQNGAWILACGRLWNFKVREVGAGMVELRLEPRHP